MTAHSGHTAALTLLVALAAVAAAFASIRAEPGDDSEQLFLSENQLVMDRMMQGMAPRAMGNVDADFATMMVPHHQGAIEMAVLELRFGRNEQLRRIAQEIIIDQQQEIGAMRLALGQPPLPSAQAHTTDMPE
jgi:uncharacterized protein (DUF305 family)